jgi:hypothetical protein
MAPESDVLPAQNGTSTDEDAFLFVLCANDEQALARTREQLVEFLESDEAAKVDMRDLAYTLGQRRSQLSWLSLRRNWMIYPSTQPHHVSYSDALFAHPKLPLLSRGRAPRVLLWVVSCCNIPRSPNH